MPLRGTNKINLRKQLRARRRSLTLRQQQHAANNFLRCLKRQPFFQRAQRIAFYSANDGELNLQPLTDWALAKRKQCFLPVLKSRGDIQLLFLPIKTNTRYIANRFGIAEPDIPWHQSRAVWSLDIVFLPLVGFDREGGRLGMGGGFYDKTFARLARRPRRPILIGVGHQCQEVEAVPTDAWDIPVDMVISDTGIMFCRPNLKIKCQL